MVLKGKGLTRFPSVSIETFSLRGPSDAYRSVDAVSRSDFSLINREQVRILFSHYSSVSVRNTRNLLKHLQLRQNFFLASELQPNRFPK